VHPETGLEGLGQLDRLFAVDELRQSDAVIAVEGNPGLGSSPVLLRTVIRALFGTR